MKYLFICFLLVLTYILIPAAGYAEGLEYEPTSGLIEFNEDTDLINEDSQAVGKVFGGTVIPFINVDDTNVYIQWEDGWAAVDRSNVVILESHQDDTTNNWEFNSDDSVELTFTEDTSIFLDGSNNPSFLISKGVVFSKAKELNNDAYKVILGGMEWEVDKASVTIKNTHPTEERDGWDEAGVNVEGENEVEEVNVELLEPLHEPKEKANEKSEDLEDEQLLSAKEQPEQAGNQVVMATSLDSEAVVFSTNDRYFEVVSNTPVYDNRTGQLVEVGTLRAGEIYPRVRAYGSNWHEIRFGEIFGYVRQSATRPASGNTILNIDSGLQANGLQFQTIANAIVYDNTSGNLVPFADVKEGVTYPIVSDFGGWYRISLAGRIGFINKNHVQRTFTRDDRFFEVTSNELPIYDNRTGSLVKVGTVNKGQVYPRVRDYGNWHEVKFGNHYGYVSKNGTSPATAQSIRNQNDKMNNSNLNVTMLRNSIVYDNTSGSLVRFATLEEGLTYPVISEYGNWYRIDVAGRIGYVSKNNVERSFKATDRYFTTLQDMPIYDNRTGSLVKVGTLEKGQSYPRVRDYGANWHEIKFGNHYGYVSKSGTQPSTGSGLANLNKGHVNSLASITTSREIPVYDNTSGSLVRYGQLEKGITFPAVSDYGSWYRILLADRVGYISKNDVSDLIYEDPILSGLNKDKDRSQAIVVTASNWSTIQASVQTYEKERGIWRPAHNRINGVLGYGGFMSEKREGDGGTPVGKYDLGTGFGSVDRPSGVTYPYRKTTSRDYWIDDVTSADYNKWITYQGNPDTRWNSYERLTHPLYKYAVHIKYNEDPIVKGQGSAIFMHVWRNSSSATAGCVAVSEAHMLRILQWLDSEKKPVIVMGPNAIINDLVIQ